MKHIFIVNPTAGGHDATDAVRAKVEAAFAKRGCISSATCKRTRCGR